MEKLKCIVCGREIEDHGRKYCKLCRKDVMREQSRRWEKHVRKSPPPKTGYKVLAQHIVKQAKHDYLYTRYGRHPYKIDCISFFKSEWFYLLTGVDGDSALRELEKHERKIEERTHQKNAVGQIGEEDR